MSDYPIDLDNIGPELAITTSSTGSAIEIDETNSFESPATNTSFLHLNAKRSLFKQKVKGFARPSGPRVDMGPDHGESNAFKTGGVRSPGAPTFQPNPEYESVIDCII